MKKIAIPKIERREGAIPLGMSIWTGADYSPNPDCSVCKGAGFLYPSDNMGNPIYSSVIPCDALGCLLEAGRAYRRGEKFIRSAGVTEPAQTFDTFHKIQGTGDALKYAKQLASGQVEFIWLLIYGGTGNGKTHLLNAIMVETISRGVPAEMINMADLYSKLRIGINDHTTDTIMLHYKTIPFLALDEYKLEYGSDWEEEKFEEIMSARWPHMATVLATNSDIMKLPLNPLDRQFPERIKSRFGDEEMARIALNSAPDFRLTK